MSVSAEIFIGFSVELDYDIRYDLVEEFCDTFPEYDLYKEFYKNTIRFVVDGMCGNYIRMMYITSYIDIGYADGNSHYDVMDVSLPDNIYSEMNDVYFKLFNKTLDKNDISFVSFIHYS